MPLKSRVKRACTVAVTVLLVALSAFALQARQQRNRAAAFVAVAQTDDKAGIEKARTEVLAHPHGVAIGVFMAALTDPKGAGTTPVRDLVVSIGEPAVSPLMRYVVAPDPETLLRSRGTIGAAIDRLFGHDDEWYAARHEQWSAAKLRAIEILGRIGSKRPTKVLCKALDDDYTRSEAVVALGRIADPSALGPLIAAARDPRTSSYAVREAVGKLGTPAIPFLVSMLDGDPAGSTDQNTIAFARSQAAEALQKIGAPAVDALLDAMSSPKPGVRAGAAAALLSTKSERAVVRLIEALHDPDPTVRVQSAHSLLGTNDARALDALIAAVCDLSQPEPVREWAAVALGAFRNDKSVSALTQATSDPSPVVRAQAVSTLARLTTEAAPLSPSAQASQEHSAAPTVSVGGTEKQPAMDSSGLARPKTVQTLVALLKDPSPNVRRGTADSLGKMKERSAADGLLPLLADASADVRQSAAKALGHIDDPKAADLLVKTMNSDSDEWVRIIAALALAEMGDPRAKPIPLDPIDDGVFDPTSEPAVWNTDVQSPLLAHPKTICRNSVIAASWPDSLKTGPAPDAAAGEDLAKELNLYMKAGWLPKGLAGHVVSCRSVGIRDPGTEQILDGDALLVRYKVRNRVFQIWDTSYDITVFVGDEATARNKRADGEQFIIDTAAAVFRSHVARGAETVDDLFIGTGESGREDGPERTVSWPLPILPHYDNDDFRKLRRLCMSASTWPHIYVSTNGYWVEFHILKTNESGDTKFFEREAKSWGE
jgi:HEAT repeat protein